MNAFEQRFSHIAFLVDFLLALAGMVFLVLFSSLLSFQLPFSFLAASFFDILRSLLQGPLLYILVVLFYTLPYVFAGLYDMTTTRRFASQLYSLARVHLLSPLVLFFVASFFLGVGAVQPLALLTMAGLLFVLSVGWRFVLRVLQRRLVRRSKRGRHHLVLIDDQNGQRAQVLERDIQHAPWLGYEVVGSMVSIHMDKLQQIHESQKIHDVMFVGTEYSREHVSGVVQFCNEHSIQYSFIPDIVQTQFGRVQMMSLAGYPVISLLGSGLRYRRRRFTKRVFDIVTSFIFLVLLSPLYLVIALAVKLTSPGPVVFLNTRVGRHRKPFHYLKFRTMKIEHCTSQQNPDFEKALQYEQELIQKYDHRNGPLYKIQDDPRLTSVGRFLRRWSLDEILSFWNVFVGQMSLVGPRPHQPREVDQYPAEADRLFDVKPGITGLPQISGRADLLFEEEMRLDIYYIENWSFWMDLGTVLKTPIAVVTKKGSIV